MHLQTIVQLGIKVDKECDFQSWYQSWWLRDTYLCDALHLEPFIYTVRGGKTRCTAPVAAFLGGGCHDMS